MSLLGIPPTFPRIFYNKNFYNFFFSSFLISQSIITNFLLKRSIYRYKSFLITIIFHKIVIIIYVSSTGST